MRPNRGLRGPASKDLPGALTDLADPYLNPGEEAESRLRYAADMDALGLFDDPEDLDPEA